MNTNPIKKDTGDELGLSEDPHIVKLLRRGEQILCSAKVFKYNKRVKRQERELLVTSKAIYNISDDAVSGFMSIFCIGSKIRRRIDIRKLTAITISTLSSEFVLHIESEYDYRLASDNKREKILLAICQSYAMNSKSKPLFFFFKDEFNLLSYTTTEENKKNGISKIPKGKAQVLDVNALRLKLEEAKKDQEKMRRNTFTMFNNFNDGEQVSLDDFETLSGGKTICEKVAIVEKKDTKIQYALKSIRKEDLIYNNIDISKLKSHMKEMNKCPFLVNLEFVFQTPEKFFLILDLKKGGDLFHHLKECRRFDEQRAKFYAAEVVLALEYIHEKGEIYGDLKPEKVLLDENGHACLADFSLSKYTNEEERGTYMNQSFGNLSGLLLLETDHDTSIDWWSLGVFVFEMLMGMSPFANREEIRRQRALSIAQQEVNFGTLKISEEAKDFILQLLNKNQKERLGNEGAAEVKKHKWFNDIDWEELSQRKTSPPFKPQLPEENEGSTFDKRQSHEEGDVAFYSENKAKQDFSFNPQNELLRPQTQ